MPVQLSQITCSAWGSRELEEIRVYTWVKTTYDSILPDNAVWCGKDEDDSDVYIGRVRHGSEMLLIKIVPRRSIAYYAYNGKEHNAAEFEVLVNVKDEKAEWVCCGGHGHGKLPMNAVQVGFTKEGKKLYVGRTHHEGLHVPGSIHPDSNRIHFPFGYKEHISAHYEVLVHNMPCAHSHCH